MNYDSDVDNDNVDDGGDVMMILHCLMQQRAINQERVGYQSLCRPNITLICINATKIWYKNCEISADYEWSYTAFKIRYLKDAAYIEGCVARASVKLWWAYVNKKSSRSTTYVYVYVWSYL